ncbi:MAG: NAD(P)H-hydrate dehydratase [Planctomycetes bacterium]|nr:NAD(P)H-hydrate dehydratase [Planctomycetota bacterium]
MPKPSQAPRVPPLPCRAPDANKGDCGKVLIVGGSHGMAGAPCLAARGALRGGAGLVKVAVPEPIWDVVATKLDECTTACLPSKDGAISSYAMESILELANWADVVVMGMGMGREPETLALLHVALLELSKPLVLDADGLFAFSGNNVSRLADAQRKNNKRGLVLTPHPGEMSRLLDKPVDAIQKERKTAAVALAQETLGVAVLKGAGTLVAEGPKVYLNKTGNPGMATGGTGDVLAGLIGALIGQGMTAYDAACLSVYLHGMAGDLAAKRLGPWSLLAGDLVDELPNAFKKHA